MATRRRAGEGTPPSPPTARGTGAPAQRQHKEMPRSSVAVGTILLCLVVVGGFLWVTQQHAAPGAATAGVRAGPRAPGAGITLPATQGTTLSLAQLRGKKVVLYFYEEST